jgi:L-asparagine transporter-like permease
MKNKDRKKILLDMAKYINMVDDKKEKEKKKIIPSMTMGRIKRTVVSAIITFLVIRAAFEYAARPMFYLTIMLGTILFCLLYLLMNAMDRERDRDNEKKWEDKKGELK